MKEKKVRTGGRTALTASQVRGMRKMGNDGYGYAVIAKYFHVSYYVARNVVNRKTYGGVK